jgi:hypothetical protein
MRDRRAEVRIPDIEIALDERRFPTITMWNRLEGRPRTADFDRALTAEIRDPLWMLTKQWQLGEFRADDAGSVVEAQIAWTTAEVTGLESGSGPARRYDPEVPLEAQVEARPIPMRRGEQPISLDLRLVLRQRWLKLVRPLGLSESHFIGAFGIEPPDPADPAWAEVCPYEAVWQQFSALAGRALDGFALYSHLTGAPPGHPYDGTSIPGSQHQALDELAERLVRWFDGLFLQPAPEHDAWRPQTLDYGFRLHTTAQTSLSDDAETAVLRADHYREGHLDWYSTDYSGAPDDDGTAPPGPPETQRFVPAPISFAGMPDTRWWRMEDRRVNLGQIRPDTTDLAKLMLIEFGLVYANDWFLFPLPRPAGSTTRIEGLVVTNVFGERVWVGASAGAQADWERWSMFTTTRADASGTDTGDGVPVFFLAPSAPKVQQGEPREEVVLLRDEQANMVWAIESRVPMADGTAAAGLDAARDRRAFFERLNPGGGTSPEPAAAVRYRVMSEGVPENWIPFIPVHVPDDNRRIQLQRAALPRMLPGAPSPPEKVRPLTSLLRAGLDQGEPLFMHEEEVPRAGTRVQQSFQRTRWFDGRAVVWLGAQTRTGSGEGRSTLRFDLLRPEKEGPPG